jgi:predicted amidophosphoribosyltransferase
MITKNTIILKGEEYHLPVATCDLCQNSWAIRHSTLPVKCPKCGSHSWDSVSHDIVGKECLSLWKVVTTYLLSLPTENRIKIQNRKEVLERDKFTCHGCGARYEFIGQLTGQFLHIHHMDKDRSNNIGINLITLCTMCHKALDSKSERIQNLLKGEEKTNG